MDFTPVVSSSKVISREDWKLVTASSVWMTLFCFALQYSHAHILKTSVNHI